MDITYLCYNFLINKYILFCSGLSSSYLQEERIPPSPYESDYEEVADILDHTIDHSDTHNTSNSHSSTSLDHDHVPVNLCIYSDLDNTNIYVHVYDSYITVKDNYGRHESISNHEDSRRSYSIPNDDSRRSYSIPNDGSRSSYSIPNNPYLLVLGSLYKLHPENTKIIENVQDESASKVRLSRKYNSI